MKVSTFFLALATIGLLSEVVSLDAQVRMAQINTAQQRTVQVMISKVSSAAVGGAKR